MYRLTEEQIRKYDDDGFLIVRQKEHQLVDSEDIKKWTSEVKGWPNENGKWMPYQEMNSQGKPQLMRTEYFVDYHAGFHKLLREDVFRPLVSQLARSEMVLFKDKINYKAPMGSGFAPHQDGPAYDHIQKIEHITLNVAVDEATPDNGCLEVVKGSHKMDIPQTSENVITKDWAAAQEWMLIDLLPGDLLFFGSHLAHRSGPNKTQGSRAAIYATYNSTEEGNDLRKRYYDHRRIAFPPDHERVAGKQYARGYAAAPWAVNAVNT